MSWLLFNLNLDAAGSGYLRPAQLAWMRATVLRSLPDLATVRRATTASNGQGGQTSTWSSGASYACRLEYRTGREGSEGGRPATRTGWVALLPHDAALTAEDQLRIRSVDYQIDAIDPPTSEPLCLQVWLQRAS